MWSVWLAERTNVQALSAAGRLFQTGPAQCGMAGRWQGDDTGIRGLTISIISHVPLLGPGPEGLGGFPSPGTSQLCS
eukprot:1146041-Pelagomonas_calceolata.AAC.18